MGFGILFRIDESSLGNHLNERRVRTEEEEMEGEMEVGKEERELGDVSAVLESDEEVEREEEREKASVSVSLEDLIDKSLGVGPAKSTNKSSGFDKVNSSLGGEKEEGNEGKMDVVVKEKPYVSKAERRKIKKGSDGNEKEKEKEKEKVKEKEREKDESNNAGKGTAANQKLTRGQRSKMKKIKEKYADQDEEERGIRMALLASAGNALKKEKELNEADQADTKEKKPVSVPVQDESAKICYKCKKTGHLARDCKESPAENTESPAGNLDDEDGANVTNEAEDKLTNDLDLLTGCPLNNDVLLYAVPVCGPYNALQNYKYRVKITPGTAKKGKAAKTAINLFLHTQDLTSREKELIKACTDPELVAAILGNVKITAPGLTQLKKQQKKGKKSSAKGS